ncbi:Bone morphogenetic protein 1 [Desmophyllum pertusum]|uniref:Bone morphogenetic protein 1 n=1 Tax=Desmophyllum pertusum TaxID=174260 RepID=A0A9W9YLB1_9CNID|nr:Bone morphogenetic protein 1 [Desmophyllum pertusum]
MALPMNNSNSTDGSGTASSLAHTELLVFAVYKMILSPVTVLGNGLLVLTGCMDPHRSFRTPSALFLLTMSMANVFTGILVAPIFAAVEYNSFYGRDQLLNIAKFGSSFSLLTLNISFAMVFALAVDYFIAVFAQQILCGSFNVYQAFALTSINCEASEILKVSLQKTFLTHHGVQFWKKGNYFGTIPVRHGLPNGITNITGSSGSLVYPSSGDYGVNETKCWKIEVPDTYAGIGYNFHGYEIEPCDGCKCDYLQTSTSYNTLQIQHDLCRWLRPGSKAFLNASEDETITFGTPKVGIENYLKSYAQQWFLIVPEGRQVEINFDTFELEQSENCKNDYVEFREASISISDPTTITGIYGPILSKRLCGSTKPSAIQSAGNMVWVQFLSDSNSTTVYKGFKASFKAGQGRLSISNPLTLLFISALLVISSKNTVF